MAATPQVFGPAQVSVGGNALGYTRQGADIRNRGFFLDVPGDELGGDQGPPIDVQYLGEIAIVRLEMTKWDETVAASVRTRVSGGSEGVPGTAGTLMFTDSKTVALSIAPTSGGWLFGRAFLRGDWEINKGTRYAVHVFEFECHKDGSGNLYAAIT